MGSVTNDQHQFVTNIVFDALRRNVTFNKKIKIFGVVCVTCDDKDDSSFTLKLNKEICSIVHIGDPSPVTSLDSNISGSPNGIRSSFRRRSYSADGRFIPSHRSGFEPYVAPPRPVSANPAPSLTSEVQSSAPVLPKPMVANGVTLPNQLPNKNSGHNSTEVKQCIRSDSINSKEQTPFGVDGEKIFQNIRNPSQTSSETPADVAEKNFRDCSTDPSQRLLLEKTLKEFIKLKYQQVQGSDAIDSGNTSVADLEANMIKINKNSRLSPVGCDFFKMLSLQARIMGVQVPPGISSNISAKDIDTMVTAVGCHGNGNGEVKEEEEKVDPKSLQQQVCLKPYFSDTSPSKDKLAITKKKRLSFNSSEKKYSLAQGKFAQVMHQRLHHVVPADSSAAENNNSNSQEINRSFSVNIPPVAERSKKDDKRKQVLKKQHSIRVSQDRHLSKSMDDLLNTTLPFSPSLDIKEEKTEGDEEDCDKTLVAQEVCTDEVSPNTIKTDFPSSSSQSQIGLPPSAYVFKPIVISPKVADDPTIIGVNSIDSVEFSNRGLIRQTDIDNGVVQNDTIQFKSFSVIDNKNGNTSDTSSNLKSRACSFVINESNKSFNIQSIDKAAFSIGGDSNSLQNKVFNTVNDKDVKSGAFYIGESSTSLTNEAFTIAVNEDSNEGYFDSHFCTKDTVSEHSFVPRESLSSLQVEDERDRQGSEIEDENESQLLFQNLPFSDIESIPEVINSANNPLNCDMSDLLRSKIDFSTTSECSNTVSDESNASICSVTSSIGFEVLNDNNMYPPNDLERKVSEQDHIRFIDSLEENSHSVQKTMNSERLPHDYSQYYGKSEKMTGKQLIEPNIMKSLCTESDNNHNISVLKPETILASSNGDQVSNFEADRKITKCNKLNPEQTDSENENVESEMDYHNVRIISDLVHFGDHNYTYPIVPLVSSSRLKPHHSGYQSGTVSSDRKSRKAFTTKKYFSLRDYLSGTRASNIETEVVDMDDAYIVSEQELYADKFQNVGKVNCRYTKKRRVALSSENLSMETPLKKVKQENTSVASNPEKSHRNAEKDKKKKTLIVKIIQKKKDSEISSKDHSQVLKMAAASHSKTTSHSKTNSASCLSNKIVPIKSNVGYDPVIEKFRLHNHFALNDSAFRKVNEAIKTCASKSKGNKSGSHIEHDERKLCDKTKSCNTVKNTNNNEKTKPYNSDKIKNNACVDNENNKSKKANKKDLKIKPSTSEIVKKEASTHPNLKNDNSITETKIIGEMVKKHEKNKPKTISISMDQAATPKHFKCDSRVKACEEKQPMIVCDKEKIRKSSYDCDNNVSKLQNPVKAHKKHKKEKKEKIDKTTHSQHHHNPSSTDRDLKIETQNSKKKKVPTATLR